MAQVKEGDRVAVRYRAVAKDRRVLASTGSGPPLEITAGGEDVLYGLSHGVIGMEPGEEAVLTIDAEDAFGEASEAVERTIPRSLFPRDVRVGDALRISNGDAVVLMWVTEEGAGDTWRLSSQHPFAGHDIEVHIEVVDS
ncbi:MAG: hypothetical protein GY811_15070 [Myxococcales bacterium]|nr:hypothetical protein [Myxococcales bacterium]